MAGLDLILAGEAFALWTWFRRGFLPAAGGVLDQQQRHLLMIEAVEGAFNQWQTRSKS
ncbi:MAG: hypothetical protein JRI97_09400 [Deltaproteobacteria bacterium]|nr:hypothetical protein [Deltaproteobacteria bacterium]